MKKDGCGAIKEGLEWICTLFIKQPLRKERV